MIFLHRNYDKTKEIILGLREKSPLVQEMENWMATTFSVNLLDINLLPTPSKKHSADLSFIIEKCPDKIYLHKDEILLEFKKVASIQNYVSDEILNNPFVEFVNFYAEARRLVNVKATQEAETLFAKKFPMIWKIEKEFSHLIVFYYTDKDITTYEDNKISDLIKNDYYSIIKKHDELNYFSNENMHISFDSKENIDKNFAGSLFYYSRR